MTSEDPRPSAVARGTLAERPLAHVFIYIMERRLSGTLRVVGDGGEEGSVVFLDGQMARVRMDAASAFLGTVLYELGYIDLETLNGTLFEVAICRRPHGQLLLDNGHITKKQLENGLVEQMRRKTHRLFAFGPEATFEFIAEVDDLEAYGGADWPTCDPRPSIWNGLREMGQGPHVEEALAKAGDHRFRLVATSNLRRFQLSPEELATAECLRVRAMTVDELRGVGILDEEQTSLLFYLLLATRQLERVRIPTVDAVAEASTLSPSVSQRVSYERRAERAPLPPPAQHPGTAGRSIPPVARTTAPPPSGAVRRTTRPPAAVAPSAPPSRPRGSVAPRPMPLTNEEALRAFIEADTMLRRGDLDEAAALCRMAQVRLGDDADVLALAAWIDAQRAENQVPAALRKCLTALDEAILKNSRCERAHYYRGQLRKRIGQVAMAREDFEYVVELNPEHVDARRELRLFEMRNRPTVSGTMRKPGPSERPAGAEGDDDVPPSWASGGSRGRFKR